MADELGSFLDEIAERDSFLKTVAKEPLKEVDHYPPVRGAKHQPKPAPRPQAKAKPPKPAAAKPTDDAAIWDVEEIEVPTVDASEVNGARAASEAQDAPAPAPSPAPVKPRQRKHAYEYFNQWDAYDVDGELQKLDGGRTPEAVEEVVEEDDGLPPGVTAAMLAKLPTVEVERRALNEKSKGNEFYKAGEYKAAIKSYTHSLRLQQNNAVVYANRGMCHLKLKQYRQALADTTAAIQLDDSYTKAYLRRGIAHRRLSQHQRALDDLDVVLSREPHNKEAQEHRRCSQIDLEKSRKSCESKGAKQSITIEEVDGDSDDEVDGDVVIASSKTAVPNAYEFEKLKREQAEKDKAERERAEKAERRGAEKPGPFVDPQAAQESEELLRSLSAMGTGMFNHSTPPSGTRTTERKEEAKAKPAICEEGVFEPASKFDGARPGMTFKSGPKGLGYYQDQPSSAPADRGGAEMKKLAITEVDESSDDEEDVPINKAAPTRGQREEVDEMARREREKKLREEARAKREAREKREEAAKAPAPAAAASGGMRKLAVEEVSSDDEEEEEVVIKRSIPTTEKAPAPAAAPAGGMRKMAIDEVSSDDDEEEEVVIKRSTPSTEQAPAPAAAPSGGMRKMVIDEVNSDDDEEEEVVIKRSTPTTEQAPAPAAAPSGGAHNMAIDEVSSDEEKATTVAESDENRLDGEALKAYEEADRIRKEGNVLFGDGQYELAMDKYAEAVGVLHGNSATEEQLAAKCLNNRAACACQLQLYAQAVTDTTRVLKKAPNDLKALMRRGFALEALERYEEALADMRKVVCSGANSAQASAACTRLTKYVAGKAKAEGAPENPTPPAAAAPAPASASQSESEPSEEMRQAANAAKERGTAAFKEGDFKRAAAAYYEACKKDPSNHVHCSNLAIALLKLGQPQHAVTAAARCVELAPSFAKGHYRLGQAHHARGDTSAAVAAFTAGMPHAAGRELAEMARELKACQAELASQSKRAVSSDKASEASPPSGPSASPSNGKEGVPKGKVDLEKARQTAKRVAELGKASVPPPTNFSSFERGLRSVWAGGKGAVEEVRSYIQGLPKEQEKLDKFVGEKLSDEFLETLVQAAEVSLDTQDAIALLAMVCRLRRFEMGWMMAAGNAKAAAQRIFQAAAALPEPQWGAAEIVSLAKKYDCKLKA